MSRRLFVLLFATALFALMLAACETAAVPTPAPDQELVTAEQIALSQTAWTILEYGVQETYLPVPGSNPSIEFGGIPILRLRRLQLLPGHLRRHRGRQIASS